MDLIAQQEAAAAAVLGIGGIILIAIVAILSLVVYFLPLVIAIMRGHHQTLAIAAVCVLLGWTFLGWVFALVWAFTNPSPATVVIHQQPMR